MRMLQVNHGYPPRYNAGSEVHCRTLSRALQSRGHHVSVFAREEDPYRPDYAERIEHDGAIAVHLANMPRTQHRYQHDQLDQLFSQVVRGTEAEIVHFHHLNHLSVGLLKAAQESGARVIFTVHDFWLACPRGQLVQWRIGGEPWPLCPGQEDRRCASACYGRCATGETDCSESDEAYWMGWVGRRMRAVEHQLPFVNRFVCPSRTAARALTDRFPSVAERVVLRDYGFPELHPAATRASTSITFGYIGTHAAVKGVDLLIRAFSMVSGDARLKIWGRPRGQETEALVRLVHADQRVSFEGEYANEGVSTVLQGVDCIVVPSVWLENSPLVIHEAQQARRCVITADAGGMAELVEHEVNGLLFQHRDAVDLARQMQRIVDDSTLAIRLGRRGYLSRLDGEVPQVADEAAYFESLYREVLDE